jgi:TRAP-type mannitol/chloroaromatic compound transport system permease small subunit
MAVIRKVFYTIDRLNHLVGKICYPLILLLSMVVLYEIIKRSFFTATLWVYETTQFIFIFCSLLSAGYLMRSNEHISVDILYSRFSRKTQVILDIITFPFFLLFVGAMFYFGSSFAYESIRIRETTGSVWDPYIFPIKLVIPISALLLLLQGIVNLARAIEGEFFARKSEIKRQEDHSASDK